MVWLLFFRAGVAGLFQRGNCCSQGPLLFIRLRRIESESRFIFLINFSPSSPIFSSDEEPIIIVVIVSPFHLWLVFQCRCGEGLSAVMENFMLLWWQFQVLLRNGSYGILTPCFNTFLRYWFHDFAVQFLRFDSVHDDEFSVLCEMFLIFMFILVLLHDLFSAGTTQEWEWRKRYYSYMNRYTDWIAKASIAPVKDDIIPIWPDPVCYWHYIDVEPTGKDITARNWRKKG